MRKKAALEIRTYTERASGHPRSVTSVVPGQIVAVNGLKTSVSDNTYYATLGKDFLYLFSYMAVDNIVCSGGIWP
jgi:hypothetical protein